jgi:hypothetical protein
MRKLLRALVPAAALAGALAFAGTASAAVTYGHGGQQGSYQPGDPMCPQGGQQDNMNDKGKGSQCGCEGQHGQLVYNGQKGSQGGSCQQCGGGKYVPLTADLNSGNCDPVLPVTSCSTTVATPVELNFPSWVENTTGETVTVTLYGKYYWIQTKDGSGPVSYWPTSTTTITLAPGESISVAWRLNSGEHSWCWTGCCTTVKVNPCPCVSPQPPCDPHTTGYTGHGKLPCPVTPKNPCRNNHGHTVS